MSFTDWIIGSKLYHKLANQCEQAQWTLLRKIAQSAYNAGRKQGRKQGRKDKS